MMATERPAGTPVGADPEPTDAEGAQPWGWFRVPPVTQGWVIHPPPTPHVCPVCEGRGERPAAFYDPALADGAAVDCRSCKGSGVVWRPA